MGRVLYHLVGATFFFAQWVIGVVLFAKLGLLNLEAMGAGLAIPIGVGAAAHALGRVTTRRA
jgi:hypothetical protein